jgi:hypothetical protein
MLTAHLQDRQSSAYGSAAAFRTALRDRFAAIAPADTR